MVSAECLERRIGQRDARRREDDWNEHSVKSSLEVLKLEGLANLVNGELALVE